MLHRKIEIFKGPLTFPADVQKKRCRVYYDNELFFRQKWQPGPDSRVKSRDIRVEPVTARLKE